MRVLIINPGADVYGSDLQMLESVTALTERGVHVTVLAPASGPLLNLVEARGAEVMVRSFPVLRRTDLSLKGLAVLGSEVLRLIPRVGQILRTVRPDAVYVNTVTVPWWTILARLFSASVVCHVHEAESKDRLLARLALYWPLRFAHSIIMISKAAEQAACHTVPSLKRRSIRIPNGVPDRAQTPVPTPTGGRFRAGVVARLSPRKGTMDALEAIARLRSTGRDVELHLFGSVFPGYEWYEELLCQRAADADLVGAVTFHGYTRPPWPAFDDCNVVLAPSHVEPFGNSVVEAQYSERPVVASDAEGHLESIVDGETGLIAPIGDIQQLAEAVARIMDQPALGHRLGTSGRRAAVQRNSLATYQQRIYEVVLGAAERRTTRSTRR